MKWKQSAHSECQLLQRVFFPHSNLFEMRQYKGGENNHSCNKNLNLIADTHSGLVQVTCRYPIAFIIQSAVVSADFLKKTHSFIPIFFIFNLHWFFFPFFECMCLEIITLFHLANKCLGSCSRVQTCSEMRLQQLLSGFDCDFHIIFRWKLNIQCFTKIIISDCRFWLVCIFVYLIRYVFWFKLEKWWCFHLPAEFRLDFDSNR